MAKEMHWRLPLGSANDVAVLRLVVERGRVVEFAIHYRALIDGREVDVVRYDTCHGHLHVHRMWLDEPNDRALVEGPWPEGDYTEAVEHAKRDLLENWKAYRAKMELEP